MFHHLTFLSLMISFYMIIIIYNYINIILKLCENVKIMSILKSFEFHLNVLKPIDIHNDKDDQSFLNLFQKNQSEMLHSVLK